MKNVRGGGLFSVVTALRMRRVCFGAFFNVVVCTCTLGNTQLIPLLAFWLSLQSLVFPRSNVFLSRGGAELVEPC